MSPCQPPTVILSYPSRVVLSAFVCRLANFRVSSCRSSCVILPEAGSRRLVWWSSAGDPDLRQDDGWWSWLSSCWPSRVVLLAALACRAVGSRVSSCRSSCVILPEAGSRRLVWWLGRGRLPGILTCVRMTGGGPGCRPAGPRGRPAGSGCRAVGLRVSACRLFLCRAVGGLRVSSCWPSCVGLSAFACHPAGGRIPGGRRREPMIVITLWKGPGSRDSYTDETSGGRRDKMSCIQCSRPMTECLPSQTRRSGR